METINYWNTAYTDKEKAACFMNVFGEAPRNEWWKSTIDGTLYPLSTTDFGDDIVEPFYDSEALAKQWQQRSTNKWYVEVLADTLENTLIWFALWWQDSLEWLNRSKLTLLPDEFITLQKNIKNAWPLCDQKKLFYNADLGVVSKVRWLKVWSNLYKKRLEKVLENWLEYALVRTTKKSDKPYKRYKNIGYKEAYSYNDMQDRVILAGKLTS